MFNSMDSSLHRFSPGKLMKQPRPSAENEIERGRDTAIRFPLSYDESDGKRNSRRISRSLSPVSASRTMEKEISILSYDDSTKGHVRSSTAESDLFFPIPQTSQSSSLVSDLFTMFSGPPKEDDQSSNKISVSDIPVIYGSAKIFTAKVLANEMSLLGGLRFLYPFLVMDRSRQIATLRIMSTLFTTFKSIQEEYCTLGVDKVILYSLHVTPFISTQASIQMLLGICDDSPENISTVLGTVGLIPFLLILSLWVCDDIQDVELISLPQDGKEEISNYFVKIEPLDDHRTFSTQKYPKKLVEDVLSSDPSNFKHSSLPYKIQLAIAKLLRLLITGSVGQLSPMTIPVSQQTPTGFNLVHLTGLLSFIQYISRYMPSLLS